MNPDKMFANTMAVSTEYELYQNATALQTVTSLQPASPTATSLNPTIAHSFSDRTYDFLFKTAGDVPSQIGQYQELNASPVMAERNETETGHDDHSAHEWSAESGRSGTGRR